MKEKHLYAIILVLALALAIVTTYLFTIVLPYTQRLASRVEPQGGGVWSSVEKSYPVRITWEQQGAQLRTIAVTGWGRASAKPNQAKLSLGVMSQETTATEALAKNSESMNNVIEALKASGIPEEDIETSGFSIYPRYSSYGETLIGFEVNHMLKITTTKLDGVGEIIDRAVEAGANRVQMVYFTFTEDKLNELRELARQGAVEDAKVRAETIADSLEIKIIGVAGATEETGYYPSPYYYEYSLYVPAAPIPAPSPIMPPTEVEVTVMIRVTYIIE